MKKIAVSVIDRYSSTRPGDPVGCAHVACHDPPPTTPRGQITTPTPLNPPQLPSTPTTWAGKQSDGGKRRTTLWSYLPPGQIFSLATRGQRCHLAAVNLRHDRRAPPCRPHSRVANKAVEGRSVLPVGSMPGQRLRRWPGIEPTGSGVGHD